MVKGIAQTNAKSVAWIVVAVLLCILAAGMLHSCVFYQSIISQARLKRLLGSLAEPGSAVLLAEISGVGGGSDSRCYTASVYRLYGSDRTAEDVLAFFRDIWLSGNSWDQVEPSSGSKHFTFYDRRDGFRLSIDYNVEGYATPGFAQFSEQAIAEARQRFATSFVIVVSHADQTTRESCWAGWEG